MLVAIAGAIGSTRKLLLKRGWQVPSILWGVTVGESGCAKSPAFSAVLDPFHEMQRAAFEQHAEALAPYEKELAIYEKKLARWRSDKKPNSPPPEKPIAPIATRYLVQDTTVEALAPIQAENPRGLLLARDELAAWFGSFDRYVSGKGGADSATWLTMYGGAGYSVDRRTGFPRTLVVPSSHLSICGSIQPAVLHRALGDQHRESGMAARFLLAMPPRKPKRWTLASISESVEREYQRAVERLYCVEHVLDHRQRPKPVVLRLTPAAEQLWSAFYDAHNEEQVELSGEMGAAWSKAEEIPARLAIVLHSARWAAEDEALDALHVDEQSAASAIELGQWFKREARRVYARLRESDADRRRRELAEWIDRRGGAITARELSQNNRRYKTTDDATFGLNALVEAGFGVWQPSQTNHPGRPAKRFSLHRAYVISAKPEKDGANNVDVDSADSADEI